jgi:galactose-1-phosphate uridylyltransferase
MARSYLARLRDSFTTSRKARQPCRSCADDDLGTCLYVDLLERELRDGRRVVMETPAFVAFQPFASGAAFETWIMPRIARPAFGDAPDSALENLATVFRRVLAGLADALGDPDYNAIIQTRRLATRAGSTSYGTSASFPGWRPQLGSSSVRAWPSIRRCPKKPPTC